MPPLSRRALVVSGLCALGTPALGSSKRHELFLTYDDGPDVRNTPMLLDLLAIYDMRATFFLVGSRVSRARDIVGRMQRDGHTIGNHSWGHPDLGRASADRILSEVDRTNDAISSITGRSPGLFRPPYGSWSTDRAHMLREKRGMETVMWDVDTLDWKQPGRAAVTQRVLRGAKPGAVVLMHDIHDETVNAAADVFSGLYNAGYVSLSL